MGGRTDPASGFASLWHTPLNEKLEAGNILLGLKVTDKRKSGPNKGYDLIDLSIPEQETTSCLTSGRETSSSFIRTQMNRTFANRS